jgi:hypothetical protein
VSAKSGEELSEGGEKGKEKKEEGGWDDTRGNEE